MLAPRRRCLDYSKVYCDDTERWLLPWNQNKHITYYIFHMLILKSVLLFHTFAPTSFDDSNFIIARLQSVIFQLPFWSVSLSLLTFHKSVILAPLWVYVVRTIQILEPFHFYAILLGPSCWLVWHSRNCPTTSKILSSCLKKRHLQVLRIKLTLLDILIEFFISGNYGFSQIALLEVCTRTSQYNFVQPT